MRFLVDAQLPPRLARAIRDRGHQAEHVAQIGLLHASDAAIWNRAKGDQATIVTKDGDFVSRRAIESDGPHVLWVRTGNQSNAHLIEAFAAELEALVRSLESGSSVVVLE